LVSSSQLADGGAAVASWQSRPLLTIAAAAAAAEEGNFAAAEDSTEVVLEDAEEQTQTGDWRSESAKCSKQR
jgi:hypothetical protein